MASDILDKALANYEAAKDGWDEINKKAREDLLFLSDEPYCQWDDAESRDRLNLKRPTLQIDQLTQFIHQVTNDIRMNTPTIKVIPAGSGSDIETAEMIEGRIKAIEYKSNADAAYDMAADFAVKSSIGYIRVDHGYVNDEGFEQEMQIKRVINPQAVFIDPSSIECDGSDAKFAFVLEDVTVEQFQKMYPNAQPVSFGEKAASKRPELHDKITIAEYFYIEEQEEMHGLLENGETEPMQDGKAYKKTRKIVKPKVMRCWLAGQDVLEEPSRFPGKYNPIVPVYGEEAWIDGKRNLYSLIRKSKSAQRMYNLWKSLETELLLKQQQAPVQAAVGQMRNFEEDWKTPDKAMVLYYHQTDVEGNPAPAPQRLPAPQIPTGIVNAARETVDDIKATMGLYNASIGQRSNETSGVAIQRRQIEGDVATFHFGDNLVRSITQVGKIIVCALQEIEDSPRVVQIIGKEDEVKTIGINGETVEGQERTYDFTKGAWDVRVITGASFTTQRQEAAAYYADLVGKMPDLMPVIGDLVFKYQDSPGAQAISARLKKLVDPKLLDESEQEGLVNPEVQAVTAEAQQVIEAAQAEIQALQMQVQQLQGEAGNKQVELAVKANETQTKAELEVMKLQMQQQELQIKARELDIKEQEILLRAQPMQPAQQVEPAAKLPDGLQVTKTPEALAMEDAHHAEEMAIKQKEIELDVQEAQQRAIQTEMMIGAIAEVKQSLDALAMSVSKPKQVIFDKDGNPVGIK